MTMRIAIIGAGFAGLATAWYLSEQSVEVTVFAGKGSSASRTAAGLMHPYTGAASKYNWKGHEGYSATLELLKIAAPYSAAPFYKESGLLRFAVTDKQKSEFKQCSEDNSGDVQWLTADECKRKISHAPPHPGIFIKKALYVYPDRYLDALTLACQERGVLFVEKNISTLQELDAYDQIVVAAGAATTHIAELANLPIRGIKGQILTFPWEEEPLPFPISSHAYIVMDPENNQCHVGSTYEHRYDNTLPDLNKTLELLRPKITALYPPLKDAVPTACRAAVRAVTPNRRPLCQRLNDRLTIFAGLGSKGLLYHALLARELCPLN